MRHDNRCAADQPERNNNPEGNILHGRIPSLTSRCQAALLRSGRLIKIAHLGRRVRRELADVDLRRALADWRIIRPVHLQILLSRFFHGFL